MATSARTKALTTTTREFFAAFLAEQLNAGSEDGARRYQHILGDFEAYLGPRANLPPAALTVLDVQGFRDLLLARGASLATARISVRVLKAPFAIALRQKLIATNPAEIAAALRVKTPPRAFTPPELRAVLSETDERWRGLILSGYYCGYDFRDAMSLLWSDVDLERGVIRLRFMKPLWKHRSVMIESVILPELRAWLVQQQGAGDTWLFPWLKWYGRRLQPGAALTFHELMIDAKLKGFAPSTFGDQRVFIDFGFHSLPHSHVLHASAVGVPEEISRSQVIPSREVPRVYTHTEVERVQRAYAKMPWLARADD